MVTKPNSFLAFSCLFVCFFLSEYTNGGIHTTLQENLRTNPSSFILVNPKQVFNLETTIHRFLSKVAVPVKRKIVLRSTPSNGKDLELTIREICQSIREKLMEFAKELGLRGTVQQFDQSLRDLPLSDDWYSEIMLQNAYVIRDLGNMINEIGSTIDLYFGEGNSTLERSKQLPRQANSFKFFGVVHDAAEFSEKLTQCLLQLSDSKNYKSFFDLNRKILDLMKHPPGIFSKILKTHADNISNPSYPNNRAWRKPWQIFLCLSITKNNENNYDDCTRELQHLETCLKNMQQQSRNERKNGNVKSWTKVIRRLSDCQIQVDKDGEPEVSCKSVRRIPRNIRQKTKYVLERILGRKVSRASPFHQVANDLGDTLSKSVWGQKLVDEACQYASIFDAGEVKLRRLSLFKEKDKRTLARHDEISEALRTYKRGVLLRTFESIKKFHRSATDMEKYLARGMSTTFNKAWQGHVHMLSFMMDWMTKLLELYSNDSVNRKEQVSSQKEFNSNEDSNSEDVAEIKSISRTSSDILKDVDSSVNGLMESMNRLSKYRNANDRSTLACIANNLLLVTVLMETIGFVSSLFCYGHNGSESNTIQFEDDWKRARRSLLSIEDDQILHLISKEPFFLEFQEDFIESSWKENK